MSKNTMTHHNKLRTTDNYTRLKAQRGNYNANAKKCITVYMDTEHEMSNILISDNRTTTEMQVVWLRLQQHRRHWLRHCAAMVYWQELMTTRLNEHEAHLDDRETTIAILNSQNAVAYEEITGLLQKFPLAESNS